MTTCPFCGAPPEWRTGDLTAYRCGSMIYPESRTPYRSHACYERRIAALEAELAAITGPLPAPRQTVPLPESGLTPNEKAAPVIPARRGLGPPGSESGRLR